MERRLVPAVTTVCLATTAAILDPMNSDIKEIIGADIYNQCWERVEEECLNFPPFSSWSADIDPDWKRLALAMLKVQCGKARKMLEMHWEHGNCEVSLQQFWIPNTPRFGVLCCSCESHAWPDS